MRTSRFLAARWWPVQEKGTLIAFQLVDEFGDGKPYAGLAYTLQDSAEQRYTGRLNADGFAKIEDCYRGPVVLMLILPIQVGTSFIPDLMARKSYPLPITELPSSRRTNPLLPQKRFLASTTPR